MDFKKLAKLLIGIKNGKSVSREEKQYFEQKGLIKNGQLTEKGKSMFK